VAAYNHAIFRVPEDGALPEFIALAVTWQRKEYLQHY